MESALQIRGMNRRFSLYLVGTSSLVGGFAQFFYNPILPEVQKELHTSMYWMNMTVTVFTIMMAVMQLVFGTIADRKGRRAAILAGMSLFACASLGAAFSKTVLSLIFFRAVQGMGAAAIPVVAAAVISDLFDGIEHTKAMGTYQLILALSPAIGPLIGGVIGARFGYFGVFLFLGLTSALLLAANFVWLKESKPVQTYMTKFSIRSFRMFLVNRKSAAIMLIGVSQALASAVVLVFIPVIYHNDFGLRPEVTGALFLLMSVAFMVSVKIAGLLEGSLGIEKSFIIGCWFNVASLVLFAFFIIVSLPAAIALLCFFGATYGLAMPPPVTILTEMFQEERATAIAMYNLCRYLGMALGPMIGAVLYMTNSTLLLFGVVAAIYAAGTGISQYLHYR